MDWGSLTASNRSLINMIFSGLIQGIDAELSIDLPTVPQRLVPASHWLWMR